MNVNTAPRLDEKKDTERTKPEFSLVFYKTPTGYAVTRHNFVEEVMQTGSIMSFDDVLSTLGTLNKAKVAAKKKVADKKVAKGQSLVSLLPQNVLLDDEDMIVWHTPSRQAPMWYRLSGKQPFALDVKWPPLLFIVSKAKKTMYVKALGSDERPTLASMTYFAPLANVFNGHALCQGSAPLPSELSTATITLMQDTIYKSAFDGFKHDKVYIPTADTPEAITFWKKKESTGMPVDAKTELHESETLGKTLERLKKNTNSPEEL